MLKDPHPNLVLRDGHADRPSSMHEGVGVYAAPDDLVTGLCLRLAAQRLVNGELREALAGLERRCTAFADRYEFAPVTCCVLDAVGTVVDINVAGAALFGQPRDAIVGRPLEAFVVPADWGAVRAHVRACASRGSRATTVVRLAGKAEGEVAVQIVGGPLLPPTEGDSTFSTVLVVLPSSDPIRQLAHDLRNDLTTILLEATGPLLSGGARDPAARQTLERIRTAAERMRRRLLAVHEQPTDAG